MSKYSLKRKTVTLSIEKADGNVVDMVLTELTAAQRDAYLGRLSERIKLGPDGKSQGVADFKGLQADLVSASVTMEDGQFTVEQIQEWPAGTVAAIFKSAQELNHLDREMEEAGAKNE